MARENLFSDTVNPLFTLATKGCGREEGVHGRAFSPTIQPAPGCHALFEDRLFETLIAFATRLSHSIHMKKNGLVAWGTLNNHKFDTNRFAIGSNC